MVLDVEDGALVERARIGQWDDPEHDLLSDGTVQMCIRDRDSSLQISFARNR